MSRVTFENVPVTRRPMHVGLLVVAAMSLPASYLLSLALSRPLYPSIALLAVVAVAGAAAWTATQRADVVAVAAWTVAMSGLAYAAPLPFLVAAALLGLLLLVPPSWLAPTSRLKEAAVTALVAGVLAWALLADPPLAIGSGLLGGAIAAARPRAPTVTVIRSLWGFALFLPAAGLAALLLLNTATGRLAPPTVRQGLLWGAAALGLAVVISLALMGLVTYLESADPRQRSAWGVLAAMAALVAVSLTRRDPSLTMGTLVAFSVPIGILAALASTRLANKALSPGPLALLAAPLAALLQLGFV